MKQTPQDIFYAFHGRLVGTKRMQKAVCNTLADMPDEIINEITKTCWFVSSMEDAYGYTLTGNDLKNQHLIFLSDELFEQDSKQIKYTIAHEIGHVILKHRNSTFVKQTKKEIEDQEKEADEFVRKFT